MEWRGRGWVPVIESSNITWTFDLYGVFYGLLERFCRSFPNKTVLFSRFISVFQNFFSGATQKDSPSRLHMATGACGTRLANQCESTSGTSLGQTIPPRTHSSCYQTPSFSLWFPKAGRRSLSCSARSHFCETFPELFPVRLASRQAVTFFPYCMFHKPARGPKCTKRYPSTYWLGWFRGYRTSCSSIVLIRYSRFILMSFHMNF